MSKKRVPASIRNKNPGAQYPGKVAKRFGSISHEVLTWTDKAGKPQKNLIATFPTDVQGAAAQFYLLASPAYADGKRTIREAITKWCGGFYVSTYLKVLEKEAGVTPDTILTRGLVCNPDVAIPLAQAMALQEAGREYPLDADGWRQAHALALPTAGSEAMSLVSVLPPENPTPSPDNDLPLPKPEARVAEASAKSWTLKGTLLGLWTALLKFLEDTWQVLSSTFDSIQSAVGGNSALGFLASSAKVSLPEFFVIAAVVTGGIVISRRFGAAKEGKPG